MIEALNRAAGGSEAWRVHTFTMERESPAHGYQTVTVTLLDRGSEISPRYAVYGTTEGGQRCAGNSGDDLGTVIGTVHWYQLDR